jgi:hypothetical protein
MLEKVPVALEIYLAVYSLLSLMCIVMIIRNRRSHNFLTKEYIQFIFRLPRFIIYILGSLALILPVPYLNLHSWDYPIAVFQPIFAYLTAPWAVTVFHKMVKGTARFSAAYAALCMMLFTGSWSVEIYLLFRDGYYMPDWLGNIPVGIVCYITMGIIWNIPWKNDKSHFAYKGY